MLNLVTKTKKSPEEVIKRAVTFFGPGGYGLKVTEQNPNCASFEGGGGMVEIKVSAEGKQTSVELASKEWDDQLKEFARKIK